MSYLVFARKYRPKTFEEMIGQTTVVQTLQNAIKSNRIAQAYLFSGMRGVGKTTAARILAKCLNCVTGPTPTPCNACEFCKAIDEDRLIDVLEIDGASNRGIDDIRQLRESVKYKAMHSRTKVIYIDEVHQITKDGFNALLKTLEEPPPSTIFIFATTEASRVPATIVSRCQHFEFKKISHRDLAAHLNDIARLEGLTISAYGVSLIAEASEGSLRDAQSLLDQAVAFCGQVVGDEELREILGTVDRNLLLEFSSAVLEERPDRIFALTAKAVESGLDLRGFFKELILHFRNLLLVRTVERPEEFLPYGSDDMDRLKEEAAKSSPEDLLRCLQALHAAEGPLKYSTHPQISFETTLVKLCHFRKVIELKDLVRELAGEGRPASQPASQPAARPAAPPMSRPAAPPMPRSPAPAEPPPRIEPRPAPDAAPPKAAEPAPPPAAAPRPSEPAKKAGQFDKAMANPGVRAFADRFKARIVSVEPSKTKPESGGEE